MVTSELRDRTRRAVQAELADAAQGLFAEQGFDATTIDAIVARAGMSRRSFFRYFSSKEDLVAQKYSLWSDDMAAALADRPAGEPAWTALRRTFDNITEYYADPHRRENVLALQAIVDGSPALHAATLAVFSAMHQRLGGILVKRTATSSSALDETFAIAVTATAWAAVQAALTRALADDLDHLPDHIDDMMNQLKPQGLED